ncbi:MAG: hypothetical protein CM1200mP26_23150 [Acidimicrobiales bacterium]|nr:MAG: hypothetical protein CM1200mP26_23150 [Acidimicrobiales bacterium]
MDHGSLGVSATARYGHHGVAHRPSGDTLAKSDYIGPGELQARNLVVHWRTGVQAHALQQVGSIAGRADHVDQHLARNRHGVGDLPDGEDLRSAMLW